MLTNQYEVKYIFRGVPNWHVCSHSRETPFFMDLIDVALGKKLIQGKMESQ